MSNEELVAAIQAGDTAKLETLWLQCEKFIRLRADKWERAFENRTRCDSEDLYQSGYFALCQAVEGYRDDKGCSFIGYLSLCLKTAFSDAAGARTVSQRSSPENNSTSLFLPLNGKRGDEDFMVEDVIRSDGLSREESEAGEILDLIEADFDKCLHKAVRDAVSKLPEKQSIALSSCYFRGMTQKTAAATMGISGERVRQLCNAGIKAIKEGPNGEDLREMLFENRNYYSRTGYSSWQRTGMSVQELEVIRKEALQRRFPSMFRR